MLLKGAEIVIECLKEQGVDTIFGYPGGTILNIYDELYKHGDEFNHILTSHEQGASHAADGYARATGKVGVCFATSGPGSTNLVTGIATAYMDSVPMVAITSVSYTHLQSIFQNKKREWNKIVERAMNADFSWKASAKKYEEMYDWLIGE